MATDVGGRRAVVVAVLRDDNSDAGAATVESELGPKEAIWLWIRGE